MISAKVKEIYSVEEDLDNYRPASPEFFCVQVRVMVGPKDSDGEESFDITVCSPSFLATICEREGFVIGRNYLFMNRYSAAEMKKIILTLVERASGPSWQDVADKVRRIGYWEFEDYQPTSH